ncbi:zinc-binding dehydrogenase [Pseudonocardia sp. DSM 110487]|nr:zinc-binding dehydrogenase [Pseudonocardia sp. DSM 110487]
MRYYEYGDPDVLTLEEALVPEPGPGQVRLRSEVIGANFVDTKFRRGTGGIFHRPLPGILTGDVVGTVVAAGDGVDTGLLGKRVASLVEDAFADEVVADTAWLAPVPDDVDDAMASMLPMGGPVALGALRLGRLAAGETVLVHAAAGGIGHLAVQLARLHGAGTVVATASSAAKLDFVRGLGADVAIDYTDPDWPERVRAAVPGGVDLVLDSVSGPMLERTIDLLAPLGRVVVYGAAGGEPGAVPATLYALRSIVGFSLLAWRAARPELARADVTDVAEHAAAGKLHTAVHARLPLTEAAKAHQILEGREQLGRVLLVP